MEQTKFKFKCFAEDWENKKNIQFRDSWNVTVNFCQQNKKIKMDRKKIGYYSEFFSKVFRFYKKEDKNQIFTFDLKEIQNDDGRCFEILKSYLKHGYIKEKNVSKMTIENLFLLARCFELEPIKNKCIDLLRTRKSLQSIADKIEKNSEKDDLQKDEKTEVNQLKEILFSSAKEKPQELSENLFNLLKIKCPNINEKICRFQEENREKIKSLRLLGWNGIKKELGSDMDHPSTDLDGKGVSFTQFRDQANECILDLLNDVAPQFGIGKIRVDIFGTNGYNSDKDITMRSAGEPRLTTQDMVLMKCVADLLTVKILGKLPGIALDTEWYVDLKFFGDQVTSEKAKEEINTLNLAMAIMHAKEGFREEDYEKFKERELNFSSEKIRVIKEKLFERVEKLYETIDEEIEECCKFQDQENREWMHYEGKVLSQYPRLLLLAKKCGDLERKIEELLKEEKYDQEELDELIVLHDLLYAMINSRQPEGTMCWPELKTTLFSAIGQKTVGETEKVICFSEEAFKKKKIFDNQLSPRKIREGFKIVKQCEETKISRKSICTQDLVLSGEERRVQFSYTILSKGVVHAGKYLLRVAESCYYALEKCFQNPEKLDENGRKELFVLWEEAKKLYVRGFHFEQCKRGKKINAIAFAVMLSEALEKKECKIEETELDKIIFMDELGGLWSKSRVSRQEKFATMVDFLVKKRCLSTKEANLISFGKELPENLAQIREILRARAGLEMPNRFLKKAEELTCAYYNVETPNAEQRINENVQKFYLKVEEFMLKYGYLGAFSVKSAKEFKFDEIWKK